jgi:hypothetical protein
VAALPDEPAGMPRRVYTVEQANRALPLVRRIAEDIVTQYRRWQDRVREFETLAARGGAARPADSAARLQREVQALAAEIDGYVAELAELGVEFKDYERGLLDFPGERDGRPVYLCWQLGEPAVRFWHELDAGFPGRRPVDSPDTT